MRYTILSLLVFLSGIFRNQLTAQDYSIRFRSGEVSPSGFYTGGRIPKNDRGLTGSTYEGNYYLLLQFSAIPSSAEREALKERGVELFDYIPNYAYLAKVPVNISLSTLGVRGIYLYQPSHKLSGGLAGGHYPAYAYENGQLQLWVHPWPSVPVGSLKPALEAEGFRAGNPKGGAIPVRIADSLLLQLAAHPGIRYVSLPEPPAQKEGIAGRSAMRLNLLSNGYGSGLDGAGVSIAIGDDGGVNHEDFRGRLFDHTYTDYGEHGDMTAGLAIGAGNIDPRGIGMAPGATLHLYDIGYYPHITNAPQFYQQYGTVITSTSYSEGCGGAYTFSAQEVDRQVKQLPQLLHVFSAGNSAAFTCSPAYGGLVDSDGYSFSNITGGRKAAKNVLAVANLYYNGLRASSSSRGPAEDGRIKPDISAFGQGTYTTAANNTYQEGSGTSAAAPSVAGAAAILVQAYRQQNNGADPPSALIKAAILNTAEDLGRPGPDYDYGWGQMHAGRALEAIQEGRYFSGSVANGGQNTHLISIPAGVKEVRVMLYWTDPEGSPVAAKALANDLDLTLTSPNGATYRPWVLSTYPHIDSLTRPAFRGTDRVNNVEQAVLQDPAPGSYSIRARGFLLGQGPQQYYIVYSFIQDEIRVTYPAGGEQFVPGVPEAIRWDAYGNNGSFTLQYSANGGSSWITISNDVSGSRRSYSWLSPNLITGQARIRVLRNGQAGQSPGNFSILGVPDFLVDSGPAGRVRVSWAPVTGASHYDVFTLGQHVMEVAASTTESFADLPAIAGQGQWYSVRARYGDQIVGQRAVARYYVYYPCETTVSLTLHFDNYPGETHWRIASPAGEALASGGPYTNQAIGSTLTIEECLPFGCFDLTFFDTYQNGMCCNFGNGYYELRDAQGNLLASGGQFGRSETSRFCLGGAAPLQASAGALAHVSCSGGNNGVATVAASGGSGSYTYLWSNGATTATIGGLSAGAYSVTVSDGQSEVQATVNITAPPPLSLLATATNASCSGMQDGAASARASGGQPPYSYSWSHGANTQNTSGLAPGAYTVTATDNNSCTSVRTVEVLAANPLTASLTITNPTCQGAANGKIVASAGGGTPPYSFTWSNGAGGPSADGLDPGIYVVSISDENNCSTIGTAVLGASSPLVISTQGEDASCAGADDGRATAQLTGGSGSYSFLWSNGATGASLNGLAPGLYLVEGRDASGCIATGQVQVSEPAPMQVLEAATPAADSNSWSVTLNTTGGAPPYTYDWQNGMTTSNASGLSAGNYSVTATDTRGCTASATFTLQATAPTPCIARAASAYYEWIESVQFGDFFFASGSNGGYGDFLETDSLLIRAYAGTAYSVTLTPGFNGTAFHEYWRIWADLNQDGDFLDAGEDLLAPTLSSDTIFSTLTLPDSLLPGEYSLRIAMKYGGIPSPCSDFPYGEVEDYKLLIEEGAIQYCNSGSQSSRSEWIQEVRIGNMANPSGNDGGYSDYTSEVVTATPGEEVSFYLEQGSSGGPYPESWRIWADLNQDGDFEDDGELLHSRQGAPPAYSGSFILPATVAPGLTRLRVSMKFGPPPGPCEPFTWGETEDYSLLSEERPGPARPRPPSGLPDWHAGLSEKAPVFYPNPVSGTLFTRFHLPEGGNIRIALYNSTGKLCALRELKTGPGWLDIPLETAHLPRGAYYVQFSTDKGNWSAPVQVVR